MTTETHSDPSTAADHLRPEPDDPVLTALRQVEAQYRHIYAALQERSTTVHEQLDAARTDLQRSRDEAAAVASALKEIHRSIFNSSVYDLILKVCLTLTGATRGVYLTTSGHGDRLDVRAAIDVDGYPSSAPSKLMSALCRAALADQNVVAYHDAASLPEEASEAERFRNCLVAPVVLRNDLSGVIVVADKAGGDFEESDADVLLSVGSQSAVAIENNRLQREVHEAYLSIVSVLAETMAARTQYAAAANDAAGRLATVVAERLRLSEYDRSVVFYATLFHDIGNIGVSDGVLNKPGPLLDAERDLIRAHAQIGHDLLRQIPLMEAVAGIVRHHHERFDGSGYPDGLRGEAIPMAARIVAVVDAYFAMLAPRSYRLDLSSDMACAELRQGAGTQFDPRVVDAFLAALEEVGPQKGRGAPRLDVPLPGMPVQASGERNVVPA